jgi:hypothetical protein
MGQFMSFRIVKSANGTCWIKLHHTATFGRNIRLHNCPPTALTAISTIPIQRTHAPQSIHLPKVAPFSTPLLSLCLRQFPTPDQPPRHTSMSLHSTSFNHQEHNIYAGPPPHGWFKLVKIPISGLPSRFRYFPSGTRVVLILMKYNRLANS